MKKPAQDAVLVNVQGSIVDVKFMKEFPLFFEHLTADRYESGEKRDRSTISLFIDDATFKCSLNDRQEQRTLYRAGNTVQEALLSLELALLEGSADAWRDWKRKKKV